MACAFAHITMTELMNRNELLSVIIPDEVINIIHSNIKFCNFGSICPDVSYLAGEPTWSDLMHYNNTGAFVVTAIQELKNLNGKEKDKCSAWLFGYVSHMVTDMVIHPIIEKKVGEYYAAPENELNHRIHEMHQDVFIMKNKLDIEISKCKLIESRIKECGDGNILDAQITKFWGNILKKVYNNNGATPGIDKWYRSASNMLDISEEGEIDSAIPKKIMATGHALKIGIIEMSKENGYVYPALNEINDKGDYFIDLPTPQGPDNYLNIFNHAIAEVKNAWKILADALQGVNSNYVQYFSDWDLGTGTYADSDNYVFWQGQVSPSKGLKASTKANKFNFMHFISNVIFNLLPKCYNKLMQALEKIKSFLWAAFVVILFVLSSIFHFPSEYVADVSKVHTTRPSRNTLDALAPRIMALSKYIETAQNKKKVSPNTNSKEILKIACFEAEDMDTFTVINKYDTDVVCNDSTAIILLGLKSIDEKYYEDHAWTAKIDECFTSEIDIKGFKFTHSLLR